VRWLFGKAFERAGESLRLMVSLSIQSVSTDNNFLVNLSAQRE